MTYPVVLRDRGPPRLWWCFLELPKGTDRRVDAVRLRPFRLSDERECLSRAGNMIDWLREDDDDEDEDEDEDD